ncbi:hypothetical protein ACIPRL_08125 [Streptomyces sp. NPDC090085]|uniref:hypothetical protein n=1 Tax=Streptomyces sp. NPDC090085 TaxID=3365943 RepID=UPI00380AF307
MDTTTLAASFVTDTVGRLGAGGGATVLGFLLFKGFQNGLFKKFPVPAVAALGMLWTALFSVAAGGWGLLEGILTGIAVMPQSMPFLGDVGPGALPLIATIAILCSKSRSWSLIAWAALAYVGFSGTGDGTVWAYAQDMIDYFRDQVRG